MLYSLNPRERIYLIYNDKFAFNHMLILYCFFFFNISTQSGCASSCLQLCKAPTQAFFTQEATLPTMLEPDFSNLSCNIVFGQVLFLAASS